MLYHWRTPDESLIYCPDRNPPRNRVIKSNYPSVRRSGIVLSVSWAPLALVDTQNERAQRWLRVVRLRYSKTYMTKGITGAGSVVF